MKIRKPIDLSKLNGVDQQHLRGVLTGGSIPYGVRRFCVSALYRDDPELADLSRHIKDVGEFEKFISEAAAQVMRASSFMELTGALPPDPYWHFGAWVIRLVRANIELLPEGPMKDRIRAGVIEEAEYCDCEACQHRPRVFN